MLSQSVRAITILGAKDDSLKLLSQYEKKQFDNALIPFSLTLNLETLVIFKKIILCILNEGYVNKESLNCQIIILASLIRYFHNDDKLTGSSISF